jgi:hypothetical protein
VIDMGDVIQVLDTFTVERRIRISGGKPEHTELCIIFPEYMDHENLIISYTPENDESANEDFTTMFQSVLDVTDYDDS